MAVRISRPLLDAIHAQASAAAPHECCGLLLGREIPAESTVANFARVSEIRPAINVAADPLHRFEVDPALLIATYREARAGGLDIIGHYHSHPAGEAVPSAVDAEMARAEGEIWLLAGGDGTLRAWRARRGGTLHGRFEPVELMTGSPQPLLARAVPERHEDAGIA